MEVPRQEHKECMLSSPSKNKGTSDNNRIIANELSSFYQNIIGSVLGSKKGAGIELSNEANDVSIVELIHSIKHLNQSVLSRVQAEKLHFQEQAQSQLVGLLSKLSSTTFDTKQKLQLEEWHKSLKVAPLLKQASTLIEVIEMLSTNDTDATFTPINQVFELDTSTTQLNSEHVNALQSPLKMIAELLDIKGDELEVIKAAICEDAKVETVLSGCQIVLQFILDDLKIEQRITQQFIQSVGRISHSFDTAIRNFSEHQNAHQTRLALNNSEIKLQLFNIEDSVVDATQIETIKSNAQKATRQLEHHLLERERFDQNNHQIVITFQQRFESLSNQLLHSVKQHTDKIYKRRNNPMVDSLTRLPTREGLNERLDHQLELIKHHQGHALFMLIDLDSFKPINDQFGHVVGDKTLKIVARALNHTVPKNGFICRWGGDEFVVIQPISQQANSMSIANQVLKNISALPLKFKQHAITLTASIGITTIDADDTLTTLLNRADSGLYQAKARGGNLSVATSTSIGEQL